MPEAEGRSYEIHTTSDHRTSWHPVTGGTFRHTSAPAARPVAEASVAFARAGID